MVFWVAEIKSRCFFLESNLKILILGHARHGKDTVADMLLAKFGMERADSSRRAAEIFLFEKLSPKYGYKCLEEAYQDRVNHRAEWFNEIAEYNTPDKTRLARDILASSDVYVGMRSRTEVDACIAANIFDSIWWVDASKRLPLEDASSFDIDFSVADIILDNNADEDELSETVDTAMRIATRTFEEAQ